MIYQQDKQTLVDRCGEKASEIASEVAGWVGWARLWDVVLVSGGKAVRGMQMLSRVMSHHKRGDQPCPQQPFSAQCWITSYRSPWRGTVPGACI